MKYEKVYSPFSVKLSRAKKIITIEYSENILKERGLAVNFDNIKETIIPLIEDSFKNQV